jgi:hypothetical protein
MHTEDVPLKDIVKMILKVSAQAYSIEAAAECAATRLPTGKTTRTS